MALKFEMKKGKHGLVAHLTVAVAEAQGSGLERRVARLLSAECAARGLAVRGTISIEVQENWLTRTVDVTSAAFVVAITGQTAASIPKRLAKGTGNAARRTA